MRSCFSWRNYYHVAISPLHTSPSFVCLCVHSHVQPGPVEYIINRYICRFLNSNQLQADLLFQLNITTETLHTLRPTEIQKEMIISQS